MKEWPVIGGVLAVLWLFISGPSLQLAPLVNTLIVGLVVGLFVAYATRNVYGDTIQLGPILRSVPAAIHYLLLFLKELILANIEVAYRVLAPSLPIEPDVVAIPLRVENDVAITTIANSITLTPGTLTMDYNEETNTLFVHAIIGQDNYESIVAPIRAWEDLALVIFDETASPEDPYPPPLPCPKAKAVAKSKSHSSEDETDGN